MRNFTKNSHLSGSEESAILVVMLEFIHRYLRVPYTMSVYHDQESAQAEATVVFLHGIGNSGATWDKVVAKLPHTMRTISLDLIGFGGSPKPKWARYDVRMQARALRATLRTMGMHGPVILVGHSLGTIIAVEYAKRYKDDVHALVLCSPPFYEYSDVETPVLRRRADDLLKRLYDKVVVMDHRRIGRLATLATKSRIMRSEFAIAGEGTTAFVQTLSASIIQQTSLKDAIQLELPIYVLVGMLDPLIVARNLRKLKKENRSVRLTKVAAGHDVRGIFINVVVDQINDIVEKKRTRNR